ncbi:MAG: 4-(cytidine 5'-diphospho)-2-C-methyl-D-erythritol kinase [Paenibacillaceae bacterium ZCTH02-B3]|nr:MAG: 4-(cytidine 5'-diphospho)-2-C-methyl-D-erythritol kinase [Paenibacillaceae bacterium ZCTH02-B3]
MTVVYEKSPAKINLLLDVLGRRDDGYHELETVMTMVDLADRLELAELPEDRVELVSQSPAIPTDERNLAHQAARLMKERFGVSKGVRITLDKRVPVAAGLAGGSGDAAAVLRGLNRMWRLGLKGEELEALGAELGSDVPYCVRGGTVLARGRGEILEDLPPPPPCWVVLARPPVSVSTTDVFARLNLVEITEHPSAERMIDALRQRSFAGVCGALGNVLEHVTLRLHPEIRQIKACMEKMGADGVLMSGSGPTVFGLVAREEKAVRIAGGLRGFCKEVYAVRLLGESPFPRG